MTAVPLMVASLCVKLKRECTISAAQRNSFVLPIRPAEGILCMLLALSCYLGKLHQTRPVLVVVGKCPWGIKSLRVNTKGFGTDWMQCLSPPFLREAGDAGWLVGWKSQLGATPYSSLLFLAVYIYTDWYGIMCYCGWVTVPTTNMPPSLFSCACSIV